MKMNYKIYGLAFSALVGGMLASCSNDVNEPQATVPEETTVFVSPVHAPDFFVWSGSKILGNTRSMITRAEEDQDVDLTNVLHSDEVEINLAINDIHRAQSEKADGSVTKFDFADLWTKLSIHVRKATNVTVTLPIESRYIVESDDFAIFQKHDNTGEAHTHYRPVLENGTHEATYEVEGYAATLKVNFYDDDIVINITGTDDDDFIKYLEKTNGDGINFEIWFYFQTEKFNPEYVNPGVDENGMIYSSDLTKEGLWDMLNDRSTVQFSDNPSYYINAFGFEYVNGNPTDRRNQWDCEVVPVSGYNKNTNFCYHLNNSPYNIIYIKKGVDKYTGNPYMYDAHVNESGIGAATITAPTTPTPEED